MTCVTGTPRMPARSATLTTAGSSIGPASAARAAVALAASARRSKASSWPRRPSGDRRHRCVAGCAAAGSPAQGAPRGLLLPRPDGLGVFSRRGLLGRGGGVFGRGGRLFGRGGGRDVALDIDAPASQLGRQARVLALF